MALIKCRECGHQVSTEASACPNCGAPIKKPVQSLPPQKKTKVSIWAWIALIVVAYFLWNAISENIQERLRSPEEKAAIAQQQGHQAAVKAEGDKKRAEEQAKQDGIRSEEDNNKQEDRNARVAQAKRQNIAEQEIKRLVKDPSSVQFRNQRGSCGEVNSKNSYGAYTGFQRYIAVSGMAVLENDSGISAQEFQQTWSKFCQ